MVTLVATAAAVIAADVSTAVLADGLQIGGGWAAFYMHVALVRTILYKTAFPIILRQLE